MRRLLLACCARLHFRKWRRGGTKYALLTLGQEATIIRVAFVVDLTEKERFPGHTLNQSLYPATKIALNCGSASPQLNLRIQSGVANFFGVWRSFEAKLINNDAS